MSKNNNELREERKMRLRILSDLLGEQTREGELYEQLDNNRVYCYSCGHRCRISDGLAGVCKVRFNRGGKLYVPWGYVAGLQCDPIEKKPFFHALPGTDALSFGMLGCDLHCAYCFTGDTTIITDRGPLTFQEAFQQADRIDQTIDAEIAYPRNLQAIAASGKLRDVRAIFKHNYQGRIAVLRPFYLPEIHCTPDHRVYATDDPAKPPIPIQAQQLTTVHLLAVPRHFITESVDETTKLTLNTLDYLSNHQISYRVPWKLSAADREMIMTATAAGESSRQIGLLVTDSNSKVGQVVKQDNYYLIPLRAIEYEDYQGPVYNMEVAEEHNYLANFLLVSNCQNWITSQVLRDPDATAAAQQVTGEELLEIAEREQVSTITSTYNEPLITSEWAVSIFREAKARGFLTSYVSNGNGTPEVLDYLRPWIDLYKVDLKSFRDRHYRDLGGLLVNVLETIRGLKARGFWMEIVTLVIPDFNDSLEELREMADFLVSVDPFIPWHLTAFHSDYKMQDHGNTNIQTLLQAAEAGVAAGLKYVYVGNAAGKVGKWEHTWCHSCGELLIERFAYHILQQHIRQGQCPKCHTAIPGVWHSPRFDYDKYQIDQRHGNIRRMRF